MISCIAFSNGSVHLRSDHILKHMGFISAIPVCSGYMAVLYFYNQVFDTLSLIISVDV